MTTMVDEARVLLACGRLEDAEAELDRILAANAADAGALILKATLLRERHDDRAALALCRRAVEAAPRSSEALNGLARCLHAMGEHGEALAAAEQARALLNEGDNYLETAHVYLTILWCLREQHRYREAVAAAEEGLRRCPDAVLAQWATVVEEELAYAQQERC